jgi:hypothetical protein
MSQAQDYESPTPGNANFISHDMRRALDSLAADPQPGGVLTRGYLGVIVPAETGRHTYVGGCQWSQPHCAARVVAVRNLFAGTLTGPAAEAFVLGTGARFVLSGCDWGPKVDHVLAPITRSVQRFGCVTVYEVVKPA